MPNQPPARRGGPRADRLEKRRAAPSLLRCHTLCMPIRGPLFLTLVDGWRAAKFDGLLIENSVSAADRYRRSTECAFGVTKSGCEISARLGAARN